MDVEADRAHIDFIKGGGEMGAIIRAKNWDHTPLGSPENWSPVLRTLLPTLLNSKFPMFLWWGEELICFYNDAYRPSLGKDGKHPIILGLPAKDAWPEIWDTIKPLIDQVLETGEATWSEDQLIPIYRNGGIEDVYWTFSYSPAMGGDGAINGVLVTCTETTEAVLNMKRLSESEDQLKFAIEAAELGTWDYNPQNTTFSGNSRLKEWFGLPPKIEILLTDATEAIVQKDRANVENAIRQALDFNSSGKYDISYTIRNKKTGEEKFVRAIGRAWFNENKEAYRFNGILQDITEQHSANIERLKLVTLMNSSQEFIGLIHPEGRMAFLNPTALRMLGWNDVIDKTILDCIYPEDQTLAQQLMGILDNKGSFSHDIRFYNKKTGRPFWMKWNAVVVRDPLTDELMGMGTVSPNIERQRQREADLKAAMLQIREKDKKFRKMVQRAPVAIVILKRDGLYVEMANKAALTMFDIRAKEFVGHPIFSALPQLEEKMLKPLQAVLDHGVPSKGSEYSITLDHYGTTEEAYFDFIFHPLKEIDNRVSGVMLVANEVTQYVKSRNRLRESEKQFKNLVMQSPIPMTIFRGRDHVIEMANEQMINEIWRKKKVDVLGKKLLDVFPELKGQKYPQLLDTVFQTGKPASDKESLAVVNGDNGLREFYIDYDYAPLFELDGSVSGIMVTVHDVTAKVKSREKLLAFSRALEKEVSDRTELLRSANQQLMQSVDDLEKANSDLQSFAYVSSHDLQEPLRKIQIFSSRILERDEEHLTELGKKDFIRMMESAERMRILIDDLLSFSRTNNVSEEYKKTDLNEILLEIRENISEKLQTLHATMNSEILPEIMAIPFQMRQLFNNLIENSLKFSRNSVPPIIEIKASVVQGIALEKLNLDKNKVYHHLSFADNGIGFDSKFNERIFEVFQRLHGKNDFKGTGIGLAIVKKIIQNHNGFIVPEGKMGRGAIFHLYIPKDL